MSPLGRNHLAPPGTGSLTAGTVISKRLSVTAYLPPIRLVMNREPTDAGADLILTQIAESTKSPARPSQQVAALTDDCTRTFHCPETTPNTFQHMATMIVVQDSADKEVQPDAAIAA